MANIKYFADLADGTTLEFTKVDYVSSKNIRGYDHASGTWVQCNRTVVSATPAATNAMTAA